MCSRPIKSAANTFLYFRYENAEALFAEFGHYLFDDFAAVVDGCA